MGRNKLICDHAAELIGAYLDDDLPAEMRHRVEIHLLKCTDCAYEAQSLRITQERLRGEVGEVIASDSFRTRVLRSLYNDNPHITADSEPSPIEPGQFTLPIGFN